MSRKSTNRRNQLIAAAVLATAGGVAATGTQASPLVHVQILGKDITQGQTIFNNLIMMATPGDTVVYELRTYLSATGTSNSNYHGHTMTSKINLIDGINSLSFDAYQLPTDAIQVDFKNAIPSTVTSSSLSAPAAAAGMQPLALTTTSPAEGVSLTTGVTGWKSIIGAYGGRLQGRGNGNNDILNIRPGQSPGTFRGITSSAAASIIGTGFFVITSMGSGAASQVRLAYSPTGEGGSGGGFQFNNGTETFNLTDLEEAGPDPFVVYDSLFFLLPEPGGLTLLGLAAAGLVVKRKGRPKGRIGS